MIKKIFFYIALLMLVSTNGFTLSWDDVHLSAGTSTDYYTGQVREIVYPGKGWTNEYLSELLWQIDNIVMFTGHFNTSFSNFSLHLSAGTALNKGTGGMDDYDWLNSSSRIWTNWSNSTIFLDKSFIFDSVIKYTILPLNNFTIPVGIGYKLNYLNWSDKLSMKIYLWGEDSSYNYVPLSSPDVQDYDGKISVINYTLVQNIIYLSLGLQFFSGSLKGELTGSFSPFVYAWDLDHHLINNQDGSGTFYLDTFTAHIWYRLEASLTYTLKKSGAVNVAVHFEELPEVTGSVKKYNEDPADSTKIGSPAGYSADGAGLASKIFSISVGYTYRFK